MKRVLWSSLFCLLFVLTAGADDFGKARWIGAISKANAHIPEGRTFSGETLKRPEVKAAWAAVDSLSQRSICLKKEFKLRKGIKEATVYICGLGFYELELNGQKVGDAVLAPLWSDYDKTVFYNTYDVTAQLQRGQNEVRVMLGNGFYNEQGGRYHKMKISFGPPTLLFRLHIGYADGRTADVFSDETWYFSPSPITFNSIYGGEDYDACATERWQKVVLQEAPKGQLRPQMAAPVKIMERYPVKQQLTTFSATSSTVYDMGQNLAGFPQITVRGKRGQTVKLTVGETLDKDGHVSQKQTGRPHYYTYTLSGAGDETWHPRFSYYGFRYVEVETEAQLLDLQSCFIYNSADKIGQFECSNPLLNDAYRLIDRAIRSNWQGVWTDCPHREKLGWLEQDWLNAEGLMANYDCRAMIEQTMRNIADAQHADGAVPTTAPQYTVFPGETWGRPFNESPEWAGTFVMLPLLYWQHYGSDSLVRQYYEPMKRYVDYLTTQDSARILNQGLGDWYDYRDGEKAGFSKNTSVKFVSTAHYYCWATMLTLCAAMLDRADEMRHFSQLASEIKEAMLDEFYHRDTYTFDTGSQTAQAIALDMHLAPATDRDSVMQRLVDDIHRHGDRLTTGDVGTRYLFQTLAYSANREHHELLYRMLNHYDTPGYGYQIKQGMTTLSEQWDPSQGSSLNHFMMGHLNNLLVPRVLGINVRGSQPIRIEPMPVGDLTWCRGQTKCREGVVKCEWKIENGRFLLEISIPEGCKAEAYLPYSGTSETVSSGHHRFEELLSK